MTTTHRAHESGHVPRAGIDSPYYERLSIEFPGGGETPAVRVPHGADTGRLLRALGLTPGTPALFVSGGAGRMDEAQTQRTRPAIVDGLGRFAHDYGVTIIDGGTSSGVMKLLGEAASRGTLRFNLVGVVPVGAVCFPGFDNPNGVLLDSGHTHFVLADGEKFGDESGLIARVALALAEGSGRRAFGVVVNGGDITRQETYDRALRADTDVPLLVLDGGGRFGDELAAAAQGAPSADPRIAVILDRVAVHIASLDRGPAAIYAELERLLTAK